MLIQEIFGVWEICREAHLQRTVSFGVVEAHVHFRIFCCTMTMRRPVSKCAGWLLPYSGFGFHQIYLCSERSIHLLSLQPRLSVICRGDAYLSSLIVNSLACSWHQKKFDVVGLPPFDRALPSSPLSRVFLTPPPLTNFSLPFGKLLFSWLFPLLPQPCLFYQF